MADYFETVLVLRNKKDVGNYDLIVASMIKGYLLAVDSYTRHTNVPNVRILKMGDVDTVTFKDNGVEYNQHGIRWDNTTIRGVVVTRPICPEYEKGSTYVSEILETLTYGSDRSKYFDITVRYVSK